METLTAAPRVGTITGEWLHWMFRQGDRVISCSYDSHRDGTCSITFVPLWSPSDQLVEGFLRPARAAEWLERMTRRLQAEGWRLVEAGVVKHAA